MNVQLLANKAWMGLKKASPTIAVVSGIGAGIVGTFLACKATTKVDPVIDEAREKVKAIHTVLEDPQIREENPELVEQVAAMKNRSLATIYGQTIWGLMRLYGPSIIAWIIAIMLILYAHVSQKKRIALLGALCVTYGNSLTKYRGVISQMYGEEKERELFYGVSTEKVEEIKVDPDTGKEIKQKVAAKVVDESKVISPYAVFFDKGNPNYSPDDPVFNYDFLCDTQKSLNTILQQQGWLFLNDARRALGFKPIPAGQILGWKWDDKTDCPFDADNIKIDLGISHIGRQEVRDFRNGYEKVFIIDFNVEPILDDFFIFDKTNTVA